MTRLIAVITPQQPLLDWLGQYATLFLTRPFPTLEHLQTKPLVYLLPAGMDPEAAMQRLCGPGLPGIITRICRAIGIPPQEDPGGGLRNRIDFADWFSITFLPAIDLPRDGSEEEELRIP